MLHWRSRHHCPFSPSKLDILFTQKIQKGRDAVLKDHVVVLPDAVVAPGQMLTSFGVYGGQPAKWIEELPESAVELCQAFAKQTYMRFQPSHT